MMVYGKRKCLWSTSESDAVKEHQARLLREKRTGSHDFMRLPHCVSVYVAGSQTQD
jgi:hypothetical protein